MHAEYYSSEINTALEI